MPLDLVTSSPRGAPNDEPRSRHLRHGVFRAPPGRRAECQRAHDRGVPRHPQAAAAIRTGSHPPIRHDLSVRGSAPALILQFLDHLETDRQNTIRTRNARLAAIHSLVRYVADCEPALAVACQRVLAIPLKKTTRPVLGYLTEAEPAHLLAQVDRSTWDGERDYLLLALLYDTGARIQELLNLTAIDFRLAAPPFVRIQGKGRRERLCPLLPQTARLVSHFLAHPGRSADDHTPLVSNRRRDRLTRHGARYLLIKYLRRARTSMPSLNRRRISPHTLRH